jgi:hypothetical protein
VKSAATTNVEAHDGAGVDRLGEDLARVRRSVDEFCGGRETLNSSPRTRALRLQASALTT